MASSPQANPPAGQDVFTIDVPNADVAAFQKQIDESGDKNYFDITTTKNNGTTTFTYTRKAGT
jgi:hypothetical protein